MEAEFAEHLVRRMMDYAESVHILISSTDCSGQFSSIFAPAIEACHRAEDARGWRTPKSPWGGGSPMPLAIRASHLTALSACLALASLLPSSSLSQTATERFQFRG